MFTELMDNYKPMKVAILYDMLHFNYIAYIIIIVQRTWLQ